MKCYICNEPTTKWAVAGFSTGGWDGIVAFKVPACDGCTREGEVLSRRQTAITCLVALLIIPFICWVVYLLFQLEPPYDTSNRMFVPTLLTIVGAVFLLLFSVCWIIASGRKMRSLLRGRLGAEIAREMNTRHVALVLFGPEEKALKNFRSREIENKRLVTATIEDGE